MNNQKTFSPDKKKFNPKDTEQLQNYPREMRPFYIGMSDDEINLVLKELGFSKLEDLYKHIDANTLRSIDANKDSKNLPHPYNQIIEKVELLSKKNKIIPTFINDGLYQSATSPLVAEICNLRGLTTAYTPYQPERSQGTLEALWLYQSVMVKLTKMDAINASLYDRSTAIFEAINASLRFRDTDLSEAIVLVAEGLLPNDLEVLHTHTSHVGPTLMTIPWDETLKLHTEKSLSAALEEAKKKAQGLGKKIISIIFTQINHLGMIEDVDLINDFSKKNNLETIGVFDPLLVGGKGLKAPGVWGSKREGVDFCAGEAQGLVLAANFGGPGLGVFGVNLKGERKNALRSTPGRFVGKAKDLDGKVCKVIVLATREQHIRREKATSNICSNQSFLATIAGAELLSIGAAGLNKRSKDSKNNLAVVLEKLLTLSGIELVGSASSYWNEATLLVDLSKITKHTFNEAKDFLNDFTTTQGVVPGIDITSRLNSSVGMEKKDNNTFYLKIAASHIHQAKELEKLIHGFESYFAKKDKITITFKALELGEAALKNSTKADQTDAWESISPSKVFQYYEKLSLQNLSPDEAIYPLGSCTMKYNPLINDWAASLDGFTQLHPSAPEELSQGNLELLWQIQEFFKNLTGLAGVTTQPLAGAQGELVGLKLFQAYHQSRNDLQRNTILIPKSAHGTNPATAKIAGLGEHIVLLDSDEQGLIDLNQLKTILKEIGPKVFGIMITNPNTAGLYETRFAEIAALVHQAGGLVYMDGANMNAIAGLIDLGKIGVDAVHNNLHKTWTIPHGGGGPGDAIVAVSEKLVDFLPGKVIRYDASTKKYSAIKAPKSIGSIHRNWGNFAHKVRAYSYILALGIQGSRKMAETAVLSSNYLLKKLTTFYPLLPYETDSTPRMHEFIITLPEKIFATLESLGLTKAQAITRMGKLFLDFGFHAPTVAFPEPLGLMIEPTESFTKKELDHFAQMVIAMGELVAELPQILLTVPHFTPISRVDEVSANKNLQLFDEEIVLDEKNILEDRISSSLLRSMTVSDLKQLIIKSHELAFKKKSIIK